MTIYSKSVRLLMRDYVAQKGIAKGQTLNKLDILAWFSERYPKIKEGTINAHLILMSVNAPSRIHYNVHSTGEDDLFYQLDGSNYRLYDVSSDPRPIYIVSDHEQDNNRLTTAPTYADDKLSQSTQISADSSKTNTDSILELLDDIYPDAYCDDCLSKELSIRPRQTVNKIGRILTTTGKTNRQSGICSSCSKQKIINSLIKQNPMRPSQKRDAVHERPMVVAVPSKILANQDFDVEHARTEIVQICHQLWNVHNKDAAPRSISALIISLRNDNLLPTLQANMMLTLCGLRNVYVYDNKKLGAMETDIGKNALSIIREWWTNAQK